MNPTFRKPTMTLRHLSLCAALALASTATLAHVTLEQPQAAPGARYKAVLKVTHGCSGSPTLVVDVTLPPGVRGARPMPKAGWKLEVLREPLAKPYQSHGRTITEDATRIRWTARTPDDALASAHYDEFVVVASLPDQPGTLYWPVTQLCERGRLDWTEVPGPGRSADLLTSPAAVLEVR